MKFFDILESTPQVCAKLDNTRTIPADNIVTLNVTNGALSVNITAPAELSNVSLVWSLPSFAQDTLVLGDAFERAYGNLRWQSPNANRKMFWYAIFSDKTQSMAYGVKTGCNTICIWYADENTLTLEIDCRNGTMPVLLNGRTLHACDIVCAESDQNESVFAFSQRFCRIMCPSPRLPKKPVYGTNTWYYAFTNTNEQLVRMDADLLAECTQGLENRPYMVIDDGWESVHMVKYRFLKEPVWIPNKRKFSDIKALADYIRSKDEIPGIWIRLLMGSLDNPRSWRMPGSPFFENISLDPSLPEVLDHVSAMIKRLKDWGFRLIKHDFSTYDMLRRYGDEATANPRKIHFHDRTRTTAEIVLSFYETIRRAAGDDCIIIGCNTISHLSAGLFELQRIADDTSPERWNRVVDMGVNCLGFRQCQHNTFYADDADCVGHTGQIPWENNRQWLHLLSVSGTPLFTSIDPRLATDDIKSDLRAAYTLASEQKVVALPLDWFENNHPEHWQTQDGQVFDYKFRY